MWWWGEGGGGGWVLDEGINWGQWEVNLRGLFPLCHVHRFSRGVQTRAGSQGTHERRVRNLV